MDEGIDTGDLLLQKPVPIPDGVAGPELARACADAGAALLVAAVQGLLDGSLSPRPQPPHGATNAPWPSPRDLEIPLTWTARHAFRFIRGVGAWHPLTIRINGGRPLRVREALGVVGEPLGSDLVTRGDQAWVQCREGVVRVALLMASHDRPAIQAGSIGGAPRAHRATAESTEPSQ